jgi:dipeptidyl aminopeptidase/acylaminoacyl peptidase
MSRLSLSDLPDYVLILIAILLAGCVSGSSGTGDRAGIDSTDSSTPEVAAATLRSSAASTATGTPVASQAETAADLPAGQDGTASDETRTTLDALVERDRVGNAVLSPDGSKVAYVRLTPDFEENKYYRDIYIADIATGLSKRFTTDKASDSNPVWSPDGSRIIFISSRSGRSQIWEIGLDGGEARQVTDMAVSVSRPVWSPDGRRIAFLAKKSPTDDDPGVKDPLVNDPKVNDPKVNDPGVNDPGANNPRAGESGAKKPGKKNSSVEGTKKKKGPHDDMKVMSSLEDRDAWRHIWVMSVDDNKLRRVTTEPFIYEDFAWSPDGEKFAFTYDPKGTRGVSEDSHVGVMPSKGGAIRRLTDDDLFAGAPSWSHDGKSIAYLRDREVELGAYLNVKDLYICNVVSGESRCLTSGDDVAVGGYNSIPHTPAVWSPDDQTLFLHGAVGPTQNLYRVPATGGALEPVTQSAGEIYSATFSTDRQTIAFLMGSWVEVIEVYASSVDCFEPKRLTFTMNAIEHLGFRAPESVRFASRDGLEVEGFLFYPDDYEKGTPVPLIVDIHGGPASRWGAQIPRFTPWRVYNSLGIAVLIVNPRGSTAYGASFQRGNYQGFGLGDLDDIMAGVDHVIAMGVAAPDQLGVTGYSYGGFMTNNIITRTDRFKAAVSIAGGSNYISCYCQANPVLPRVFYGGPPWGKNRQLYFEHSPIIRVGAVTTPTLFLHGEKDRAVHVSQSTEFFRALAEAGVTTELVLYPREGHSIYEPCHWRDYMQRTVDWFCKFLIPAEPPS